jgi:hypothetical protein
MFAQFDAVFHCDKTRAVEPLERTSEWEAGEVPETFPSGCTKRVRSCQQHRYSRMIG